MAAAVAVTNFSPSDERQDDHRSIIPFTIRDKIDAPTHRMRQQSPAGNLMNNSTTNGPVQYDEPYEGDQPSSGAGTGAGAVDGQTPRIVA